MTKRRTKSTPHGMWAATNRKSEEQEVQHDKDNAHNSAGGTSLPNLSTSDSSARF